MKRYHEKIYFPDAVMVKELTEKLNSKHIRWTYSKHCLENLKYRALDNASILLHIKNLELKAEEVFEYYIKSEKIEKLCYRISYSNLDIILVVSNRKNIITIYMNNKDDKHETLNPEQYTKESSNENH